MPKAKPAPVAVTKVPTTLLTPPPPCSKRPDGKWLPDECFELVKPFIAATLAVTLVKGH